MSIWEIVAIGLGLSMDAAAVTLCDAMGYRDMPPAMRASLPVAFGLFQGVMPLLGYFLGSLFSDFISRYAGITTLVILAFIGANMIKGAFEQKCDSSQKFTFLTLLLQSIATSIDAFAVGVSFYAMGANIAFAAPIIALTTFCCSLVALAFGKRLGESFGQKAQIAGGVVLILIGIKSALGI